jgi:hypothetical protein
VFKAFAKHLKLEAQRALLAAERFGMAAGTPARLAQLAALGALRMDGLRLLVVDVRANDKQQCALPALHPRSAVVPLPALHPSAGTRWVRLHPACGWQAGTWPADRPPHRPAARPPWVCCACAPGLISKARRLPTRQALLACAGASGCVVCSLRERAGQRATCSVRAPQVPDTLRARRRSLIPCARAAGP